MQASHYTNLENNEIFSVATLLYTRLRRITGRVVDVAYLMEHADYALHVCDLAFAAGDEQLNRLGAQLKQYFTVLDEPVVDGESSMTSHAAADLIEEPELSEEEIYRAQVSHHYIGALR